MEGGTLDAIKKHWYLVLGIAGFLLWFTSQVVAASGTLSDLHESINNNEEEILDLLSKLQFFALIKVLMWDS